MSDAPDPQGFFDANEAELRRSLLERAEEIAQVGSWDLNRDTREMVWSDNLFRIFGFEPRTLVPTVEFLFERIHPADRDHVERVVGRALTEGVLHPLEYRILLPDSSLRHVHALATLDEREGGEAGHIVGALRDISERRIAEEFRDVVMDTIAEGLYATDGESRLIYMNSAAEKMLGWRESELKGALIHEAIHFQRADGSPYPAEECPLMRVATEGRTLRMGDEAFTTRDGAILEVTYSAAPLHLGASDPGVVVVFRDTTLERIEQNRVRRELDALTWLGRIRDALDEDRLVLYSQPIVPLTGDLGREELLLRMITPGGEVVSPGSFLPTAERYGLIVEIDELVVRRATRLAAEGRKVEANLSASSLGSADFLALIEAELQATGADPDDLVFEITETALIDNLTAGEAFARGLTETGCGVALDDFGTGFGSFTYLKTLPIRFLKIDIDFVRDLDSNPSNQYLVKAIVGLARDFGCQTIAEGVENARTLEIVEEFGVDFAQGFHLGRPASIESSPRR
ncbi:MAG TPA: EAL domain-containing protein [Solirubrobacterales bacterium]|jgi:PAS domain S-box-containing protein|nr:EAL domain-containing protein [Solirubrobacterales bacterium]